MPRLLPKSSILGFYSRAERDLVYPNFVKLRILLAIFTMLALNLSTPLAHANQDQNWNFVGNGLTGFSFARSAGFAQTITPLYVPSQTSSRVVDWELSAGRNDTIRIRLALSSEGFAQFGIWDVSPDVRFTQKGSTSCFASSPNFHNQPGTFSANCKTPVLIEANVPYRFIFIPDYSNEIPTWNTQLLIGNSKVPLDLGTIRFFLTSAQIAASYSTGGHNQTSVYGNVNCKELPKSDAIYSPPENLGANPATIFVGSGTAAAWNKCPEYKVEVRNDRSTLHRIGNLVSEVSKSPTPAKSTPTPTPEKSTPTPTATKSQTEKPEKPTFSLINIVGNNVEINVGLGNDSNLSNVFLLSPGFTGSNTQKIPGVISGQNAKWSIPISQVLSGKLVPISIIKSVAGVESDPLTTELQMPNFVKDDKVSTAPKKPTAIRTSFLGTDLIVTAQAEISGKAVPKDAYLYSSDFGIAKNKPISGDIIGSKVVFSVPVMKNLYGKQVSFNIFTSNKFGVSEIAKSSYKIPKIFIPSAPISPVISQMVICAKGDILRTFAAKSCPPGWIKK